MQSVLLAHGPHVCVDVLQARLPQSPESTHCTHECVSVLQTKSSQCASSRHSPQTPSGPQNGVALVLADHGNCEQMIDPATGGPHTAHTTYPVELIVMDDRMKGKVLKDHGRLADVAPTALEMMGLSKPAEMSGRSLISG